MTSKSTDRSYEWESELTEEKLQDQIKAAKEKWKEQRIKLEEVCYENDCLYFVISGGVYTAKLLWFNKRKFKCLENLSDEDIAKVKPLGDRAIQWEDQNIQLSLDRLFDGIQLKDEWLVDLGK